MSVWSDDHTKYWKIFFLSGCSLKRRSKPYVTPHFMMSFWKPPVQRRVTFKRMCSSGWTVISNPYAPTYSTIKSYYKAVMCLYWAFCAGDPCPQPQPITSSDLHPCTKASSMSYFDNSSKAGFGVTVAVLFLFPVGQCHSSFFVCAVKIINYYIYCFIYLKTTAFDVEL